MYHKTAAVSRQGRKNRRRLTTAAILSYPVVLVVVGILSVGGILSLRIRSILLVACALSVSRIRSLRIDLLVACILSISRVRSLRIDLLVAFILSISRVRSLRIDLLVA